MDSPNLTCQISSDINGGDLDRREGDFWRGEVSAPAGGKHRARDEAGPDAEQAERPAALRPQD